MSLSSGVADFLAVATSKSKQWSLLQEFLVTEGDRVVQFSGYCSELTGVPLAEGGRQKSLSWTPLQRTLLVTSHGLLCAPRTSEESGIFFRCRCKLDAIAQVVVMDTEEYGPVAQVYIKSGDVPSAMKENGPFPGLVFPGQSLHLTLMFTDASIRKSFLMSLSIVQPNLRILQKKSTGEGVSSTSTAAATPQTPSRGTTIYNPYGTPTPVAARRPEASSQHGIRSPAPHTPSSQFPRGVSAIPTTSMAPSFEGESARYSPSNLDYSGATEVTEDQFEEAKSLLHSVLVEGEHMNDYAYENVSARPLEEDPSKMSEREEVKALLETRERKMCQNIEFKMKYPTKVPTRVQPGVEYDKAHEERMSLPDDIGERDLLGPSLLPLWLRWKRSGGLGGRGAGGGTYTEDEDPEGDWNIFDSQDLIDSLRVCEDFLHGKVGTFSVNKVMRMRELVQRERDMYRNKMRLMKMALKNAVQDETELDERTPVRHQTKPSTRVVPFTLSQSPVTTRKLRLIDSDKLIGDMRRSFDKHQKAVHEIRKSELQREVYRTQTD